MQSQIADGRSSHRVLVVVGADFPGEHDPGARAICEAVAGREVLVVAPASAVPGERWVVDLGARQTQARSRSERWAQALAFHAASVSFRIGDASPSFAIADAQHDFAPHDVHVVVAEAPAKPRRRPTIGLRLPAVRPVMPARPARPARLGTAAV